MYKCGGFWAVDKLMCAPHSVTLLDTSGVSLFASGCTLVVVSAEQAAAVFLGLLVHCSLMSGRPPADVCITWLVKHQVQLISNAEVLLLSRAAAPGSGRLQEQDCALVVQTCLGPQQVDFNAAPASAPPLRPAAPQGPPGSKGPAPPPPPPPTGSRQGRVICCNP